MIDFRDSNLYPALEASLPYQAAMLRTFAQEMKRRSEGRLLTVAVIVASVLAYAQAGRKDEDPSGKPYFPADREDLLRFSEHLRAMGEPSLLALSTDKTAEAYRFLYAPTFSKPICYRAFPEGSSFYLVITRLNGKGGYDPGTKELTARVELSKIEFEAIARATNAPDVRNPISKMQADAFAALDGAQWILETLSGGNHHVVQVQSPERFVDMDPETKNIAEEFAEDLDIDVPDLTRFAQACRIFVELGEVPLPNR